MDREHDKKACKGSQRHRRGIETGLVLLTLYIPTPTIICLEHQTGDC